MKKMSNKGFTLIELLAVITIMGILMMVAIPSVSRTIENSRRDTFADNVRTYINAVRNAALADEIKCYDANHNTDQVVYSSTPDGNYYFKICTDDLTVDGTAKCNSQNTKDMMETVAKSSWGNAELYGVVSWNKSNSKATYTAAFVDASGHGMKEVVKELDVKRSEIYTTDAIKKNDIFSITYYGAWTKSGDTVTKPTNTNEYFQCEYA